jgi:hypothetical protein
MIFVTVFITFVFAFLSLYKYVKRNEQHTEIMYVFVTLADTFIVLSVLYLSVFSGYVFSIISLYVAFFSMLILMYIRIFDGEIFNDQFAIRFEPVKNTLLLLFTVVLPFFIFLTIFRFLPWYIQFFLSILFTGFFIYIKKYLQAGIQKFFYYISINVDFDGARKYIYLWLGGFGTILLMFAFNFPTTTVNTFLNLENHKPIYNFINGYDVDIENNYSLELLNKIISDTTINFDYDEATNNDVSDPLISSYNTFTDEDNNISYSAYVVNNYETKYIKEDQYGHTEEYVIRGIHNTNGIVIDGVIYLLGDAKTNHQVIEVMDGEFAITGIANIPVPEKFLYNKMEERFIVIGYKVVGDTIQFTTSTSYNNQFYYHTYELVPEDVDIQLPFYSHFSLGHLLIAFIFLFVPASNYQSFATTIDFKSRFTSKKAN